MSKLSSLQKVLPGQSQPIDVFQKTIQQLIRLLFLSWILAWLLSNTSSYPILNLPIAALLVLGAKWLAVYIDQNARPASAGVTKQFQTIDWRSPSFVPHTRRTESDRDAWRTAVNSKIVEFAWEKFCNSVLQEWVYEAWYAYLTPDREFPAEIRRVLNNVFGELCARSRRVDLRSTLIKDMSEIIIDNLQLYRQTVEAIGAKHFENMTPAAKEKAFQAQLKSDDKLHAALQSPDGHYKVLRALADGVVTHVLPAQELELPLANALVRELLAGCVLRPVMMYFTPYCINQLFLAAFPDDLSGAARPANSSRGHVEGSQDFEKRAKQSADLEHSHYLQQQQVLESRSNAATPKASGVDEGQSAHMPSSSAVRFSNQGYRRTSHLRSRSWDDTVLPHSHALHSTVESLLLANTESAYEEGVRSEGEQRQLRHTTSAHLRSAPTRDSPNPPQHPGGIIPPASELRPSSATSQGPLSPSSTPTAAPLAALPDLPASAISPSSQTLPAKGSQGSLPPPPAATPASTQQTAAAAAAATTTRPAFDALAEMTAASLLQQHLSQQEVRAQLQATVLAAQTFNDGSKDFVLYQLQVSEADNMWTVSRRYRNFEALHRRLKETTVYRELGLGLPPKRIMVHTNDKSFMMKRGRELQAYLDALLQEPRLARCEDVRKFLSSVSDMYSPEDAGSLFKSITSNVDMATKSMKRAVGGVFDEGRERITTFSSMFDSTRRIGVGGLAPRFRAAATTTAKQVASMPTLPPRAPSSYQPAVADYLASAPDCLTCSMPELATPAISVDASSSAASNLPSRGLLGGAESPPPIITKAPPSSTSTSNMDFSRRMSLSNTVATDVSEAPSKSSRADAVGPDDYMECVGMSAPLYSMVVAVFELQGRGFFRRQVVTLATQMLSLVAGDAIDSYLADQLKSLSSEPNIARWISTLQSSLWPGGVWFSVAAPASSTPTAAAASKVGQAKVDPAAAVKATINAASTAAAQLAEATPKAVYMEAETFMEYSQPPADEAEVAEKVRAKLFAAAPAALVRLVGQKCYNKSMSDVYEMLQSPTFTYQIGYRALETVAMALFPELRES